MSVIQTCWVFIQKDGCSVVWHRTVRVSRVSRVSKVGVRDRVSKVGVRDRVSVCVSAIT